MALSVFQMLKIGIGPSSSHTVGPMKAAKEFLMNAKKQKILDTHKHKIKTVKVDLFGSLALTGRGHATDKAIIMGLIGEDPDGVDTSTIYKKVADINKEKKLKLLNEFEHDLEYKIEFHKQGKLPYHTNGMRFILHDEKQEEIFKEIYYSTGGGFIVNELEMKDQKEKEKNAASDKFAGIAQKQVPYPFKTADELFYICKSEKKTIAEVVLENEKTWMEESEIRRKLDRIWEVMQNCIIRGLRTKGTLPGPLKIERRAPTILEKLLVNEHINSNGFNNNNSGSVDLKIINVFDSKFVLDPMDYMNWINMWAMAVSEENSIGGQVVTAPTNGSAGVIPAVISYYKKFYEHKHPGKLHEFLLTAAAIGMIIKLNATVSGAEGGCQAEIGAASSMAAAGLTAALGGNLIKIENAAEIAMEHFIGMTCDPVGGMVQIPCIERNAVGAVKAVNSTALALMENNKHKVSLDRIVQVMKQTGDDMKSKYKETSKGGLAKILEKDFKVGLDELKIKQNNGKKSTEEVDLFVNETLC